MTDDHRAADEFTEEEREQLDRRTMDLAERRAADRRNASYRRKSREAFEKANEERAKADHDYKVKKATRFIELRDEGQPVEVARLIAEKDAAPLKRLREFASGRAKAALLRIDEAEAERVSIRDIHKTSEKIDGLAPS